MILQLKAKHFAKNEYSGGEGAIAEALKEIFPSAKIFQGVELTNVSGRHYTHPIYSRHRQQQGAEKAAKAHPYQTIDEIILTSE